MELTIILPALNEGKVIGKTITKLKKVVSQITENYEILVVDSDSTDDTAKISRRLGARVINEPKRGYGNALRRGFDESRGEYIIMYDPDGTYDEKTIIDIHSKLKSGYDYVNANRFAKLTVDSMSLKHQIGNKIINMTGNIFFGTHGKDMLSGYKGFRKNAIKKLNLKSERWDFNVEIQSKLKINNLRYIEIPTKYYPRIGESKLSGFDAAWNNFRYILLRSPNFIFITPALFFSTFGAAIILYSLLRNTHLKSQSYITFMLAICLLIVSLQTFLFGAISKNYLVRKKYEKKNYLSNLAQKLNLEKSILIGLAFIAISLIISGIVVYRWIHNGYRLNPSEVYFSMTAFAAFIISVLILTYGFFNQMIEDF
ncbi:MAG: glycosyltransferase family 2 protein [Candidatus Woesearchaeota archaeon]